MIEFIWKAQLVEWLAAHPPEPKLQEHLARIGKLILIVTQGRKKLHPFDKWVDKSKVRVDKKKYFKKSFLKRQPSRVRKRLLLTKPDLCIRTKYIHRILKEKLQKLLSWIKMDRKLTSPFLISRSPRAWGRDRRSWSRAHHGGLLQVLRQRRVSRPFKSYLVVSWY